MNKQVHMTENVACVKAVEKTEKLKTMVPCLQVMFVNICHFIIGGLIVFLLHVAVIECAYMAKQRGLALLRFA